MCVCCVVYASVSDIAVVFMFTFAHIFMFTRVVVCVFVAVYARM